MNCTIHPFKQCTIYNKQYEKLQCPLCLMTPDMQKQVIDNAMLPLCNTSVIDIDLIESMAHSYITEQQQPSSDLQVHINQMENGLLDIVLKFQNEAHKTIDIISDRLQTLVMNHVYELRMKVESQTGNANYSKQINESLNNIRSTDTLKCIESVSQLHKVMQTLKHNDDLITQDVIQQQFKSSSILIQTFNESLIQKLDQQIDNIDQLTEQVNKVIVDSKKTTTTQMRKSTNDKQLNGVKSNQNNSQTVLTVEQIKQIELQASQNILNTITSIIQHKQLVLVGTSNGNIELYDSGSFQQLEINERTHFEAVKVLGKSSVGDHIASGGQDKQVKIWQLQFDEDECRYHMKLLHDFSHQFAPILSLVMGQVYHQQYKQISILISGAADNAVRIWDYLRGDYLYTYQGHAGDVHCVQLLPSLKMIASGSQDKTIRLWDASNYKINKQLHKFTGHTDSVLGLLAVTEENQLLSSSLDKTLRLWDAKKKILLRTITCQPGIALTLSFDAKIRVYDYKICLQIHEIHNLKRAISCFCVDHINGQILCGEDNTISCFS